MKILYITDYLPYPPISGDTIRIYNIIRGISRENEVTLFVLFGAPDMSNSILHLRGFCKQVTVFDHQWPDPLSCLPDMLRYFISGTPVELCLLHSQDMANQIHQLTAESNFEIVHIEHSRMAFYRENINSNSRSLTFLTFHNIAYDQFARISLIQKQIIAKLRTWLFSWQLRRWEPSYAGKFTRCLTVSDVDRKTLLARNPGLQVEVIPNGTDTKKYKILDVENNSLNLLFIGSMSYAPCVDGAVYFCTQVLPHVQQVIKDVNVWIVGANPTPDVLGLASERVHVTGYVDDILSYYKQAAVSVVPLRAGGGTRLKILESMALGRPVVSTSIGCEGLNLQDGQHLLIADDPKDFAQKIVQLLTDHELYQHIVNNAIELAVTKYDWDVIVEKLLNVYKDVVGQQGDNTRINQCKKRIEK